MSLLKKSKSKKLQSLVLSSVLALSISNTVMAAPPGLTFDGNIGSIDLSHEFKLDIVEENSGDDGYAYFYYTPVDKTVSTGHWGQEKVTYKGGILYLISGHTSTPSDGHTQYSDDAVTALGNAADIFGEGGMTEEDIKDLVDDAIHNVQGDQTVNGSQDITGDQTVEGEQTVKSVRNAA